jgi:hypothetical protein
MRTIKKIIAVEGFEILFGIVISILINWWICHREGFDPMVIISFFMMAYVIGWVIYEIKSKYYNIIKGWGND